MAGISPMEFGQRVGVSDQTVRNWVKAGIVRGYRLGPRLIRIDESELDRILGMEVA